MEEEKDDEPLNDLSNVFDAANDPVRMYLREMGSVPLLSRQAEIGLARRIERGQRRVLDSLSQSELVGIELRRLGDDIRRERDHHSPAGMPRRRHGRSCT